MNNQFVSLRSRHPLLCRWWLRTRPCRLGVQLGPPGIPAAVELYVPLWAWPLELTHRVVFGAVRLCLEVK